MLSSATKIIDENPKMQVVAIGSGNCWWQWGLLAAGNVDGHRPAAVAIDSGFAQSIGGGDYLTIRLAVVIGGGDCRQES